MLDTFAKITNPTLRGFIVWVPMVTGDSALDAAELVSPEKRFALQAWDAKRTLGEAFAKTLSLNCPAWDVYLVYKPGVQWDGDFPPQPNFWMHQLDKPSGANQKLHLQPRKFELAVRSAFM